MASSNTAIADHLDAIAARLDELGADTYRIRAYRDAADVLRGHPAPVEHLYGQGGRDAIEALPAVGEAIAGVIVDFIETGSSTTLDGLTAAERVERELASVPGIGSVLAHRIREAGIETLDALREAARDGSLTRIPGLGSDTAEGILEALRRRRPATDQERASGAQDTGQDRSGQDSSAAEEPPVAELLDVDREYRRRAAAGDLQRIAPRRNNPSGEAWLPLLHTTRGERRYTALFSNTDRAHELGTTDDWVVLYEDEPDLNRQWTVITATRGALEGKRIVPGRERETRAFYEASWEASPHARRQGRGEVGRQDPLDRAV